MAAGGMSTRQQRPKPGSAAGIRRLQWELRDGVAVPYQREEAVRREIRTSEARLEAAGLDRRVEEERTLADCRGGRMIRAARRWL
jgi:hypothetical protein